MPPPQQPIIPYGHQTISEADISAVLASYEALLTRGLQYRLEQSLLPGLASHGVAVNSATSALHLACLALGLSQGLRSGLPPLRLSHQRIVDLTAVLISILSILILPLL